MGVLAEGCVPSLQSLCGGYIVSNLDKTLVGEDDKLKDGVELPIEVSQGLFDLIDKKRKYSEEEFLHKIILPIFSSSGHQQSAEDPPHFLKLYSLDLQNSASVSDVGLKFLLKTHHRKIRSLNLHNCVSLTKEALSLINNFGVGLSSLTLGSVASTLFPPLNIDQEEEEEQRVVGPEALHKFVAWGLAQKDQPFYSQLLNSYTSSLTFLDLSQCAFQEVHFLNQFHNLRVLLLFNTKNGDDVLHLVRIHTLRTLDISCSTPTEYTDPVALLTSFMVHHPRLLSLDISGTNLAGPGVSSSSEDCDIPGLNSRINSPLEYLGLYGCLGDACRRHFIPAKRISGDKDQEQIITACEKFKDRHLMLNLCLNELFNLFKFLTTNNNMDHDKPLDIILSAMETHVNEKAIQISASASLFYIVKNGNVSRDKRRILLALVNAMDVHKDNTMMRNGCLTICHFKIPQDVMFLYEKLVLILLNALVSETTTQEEAGEEFVERLAIYLLNSLACQVDGEQKKVVGNLGAITRMLEVIKLRVAREQYDDVLEIAWSTMWNVTDETPDNCVQFLNHNGMDLFLDCLEKFPGKPELLRNMMGLLGNVAEVRDLRPKLMTTEFILVFYSLLNSTEDTIEVSYNAAGVLAHILSDGESAWRTVELGRELVRERMERKVIGWNVESERNINYRSFKPILSLLTAETDECKLWAAWALANLTTVYPEKYVQLLKDEGGVELLRNLSQQQNEHVKVFAIKAVNNVNEYDTWGQVKRNFDG